MKCCSAIIKSVTTGNISTFQVVDNVQDQEFTVPDLTQGKEYLFRVLACNKCGPGEPAYIDEPVNMSAPASKFPSSSVVLILCVTFLCNG